MIIKHKKKNYSNSLSTPIWLFRLAQKIWKVKCNLDIAATNNNSKCRYYIDRKINFLKTTPEDYKKSDVIWFNFPHPENGKMIRHLVYLWKKVGFKAIGIVPINVLCSNYSKKYILRYVKFEKKMIIQGRINFLTPISQKASKLNSVNGYVTLCYPRRKVN